MVLMSSPAEANHACKANPDRLNGNPEAKLISRTARMRLSLKACRSVGLGDSVKGRQ